MAVEHDEPRLIWPPDLLAREAQALLDAIPVVNEDDMRGLLEEAFARAARRPAADRSWLTP